MTVLAMDILKDMKENIAAGLIPSSIYYEPEIYELEKKKVLGSTWVFVAHESEIPNSGDFVVRKLADDSLIIVRSSDGSIHAHFNYCTHRGMQVCRVEEGNSGSFTCPYHGWNYKNTGELLKVPFEEQIYGAGMDKKEFGLKQVPQMGVVKGLIFVCKDPNAPTLEEYLGNMKWYLDLLLSWGNEGMEVYGPPQRWIIDCNWKIPVENVVGDSYHTPVTHRSGLDTGLARYKLEDFLPGNSKDGAQIVADCGTVGFTRVPIDSFLGYPRDLADPLEQNLSEEQFRLMKGTGEIGFFPLRATIFPNFSLQHSSVKIKPNQIDPTSLLAMRTWQPISSEKIEVLSWALVPKSATDEYKRDSHAAYLATFGISGMFDEDDIENWRSISRSVKGTRQRSFYQNVQMGLEQDRFIAGWPGPGQAYSSTYTEAGHRFYLSKWLEYMEK